MIAESPLPKMAPRAEDAHKVSVGRVLVVGGCTDMAGAPALAARGAIRAGAGLVTLAVPRVIQPIAASFLPEVMTTPLPCLEEGVLSIASVDALIRFLEKADALVLGPGLGRMPATAAFVHRLLEVAKIPVVLDADGLHALGQDLSLLAKRGAPTVLTPHNGEATTLLGTSPDEASREDRAVRLAVGGKSVCVLKGPATIVTDGERMRHNATGGPVLATGGTGDVLAGVVGAFLAGLPDTGGSAFGAACLAVHVHGAAGDALAKKRGHRGVIASEIADALVESIEELVR